MKRVLLSAVAAVAFAAISACSNLPSIPVQTPVQIAQKVCAPAQAEIGVLQADGIFTGGAAKTFTTVQDDVTKACNAILTTPTPTLAANLSTLSTEAFPLLLDAIAASSLSQNDQGIARAVVLGLQSTVALQLSLQPSVTATAPVAASQ